MASKQTPNFKKIKAKVRSALVVVPMFIFLLLMVKNWYAEIPRIALDNDETVWVLDAQFYEHRKNHDWQFFALVQNSKTTPWSDIRYRVIDQPQTGKYFFGLLFDLRAIHPWSLTNDIQLYRKFAHRTLPNVPPHEARSVLGDSVADAIMVGRFASATVALGALLTFGILLFVLYKNSFISIGAPLLLFMHPTFQHFYRLAIPNPLAALCQLVAIGSIVWLFSKQQTGKWRWLGWSLTGVVTALATSIKLHGMFLVVLPLFLEFGKLIERYLRKKRISLEHIRYFLTNYGLFLSIASLMFYFLEPELWNHPVEGVRTLLGARLYQQQRFTLAFQDYSLFETVWFIVRQYLRLFENQAVVCWLGALLGWGVIVSISNARSSKTHFFSLLTGIFIVTTNLYYATVGFERYALPSIFVFCVATVVGGNDIFIRLKKRYEHPV